MLDIVAPGHRLGPAGVALQVGGEEAQPIPRIDALRREHRPHLGLARQLADGGADSVPRLEQLEDDMAADKAGPARDQDRMSRHSNDVRPPRMIHKGGALSAIVHCVPPLRPAIRAPM